MNCRKHGGSHQARFNCVRPAWVWIYRVRVSYRKVAVKKYLAGTVSERQGRIREDWSEGSLEQNCEATNRNIIQGLAWRLGKHMITKPYDLTGKVNDAFAQGRFTFLSGEIWQTCVSYLHCDSVQRGLAEQLPAIRDIAIRKRAKKAINRYRAKSACIRNHTGDLSEVSRSHSSRTPGVMLRTWWRAVR